MSAQLPGWLPTRWAQLRRQWLRRRLRAAEFACVL